MSDYGRRVLNIGDIHANAFSTTVFKDSVEDTIMNSVTEYKPDIIVLHGDIFDSKVSLESQASKDVFRLFTRLIEYALEENKTRPDLPVEIVTIKGTLTHDYSQLENFHQTAVQYSFFHVVETCTVLKLHGDYTALVIPEEYPESAEDFYAPFFYETDSDGTTVYRQYDAIWGHGQVDVFSGFTALLESESFLHKTPVIEAETLLHLTSGVIAFGHIHVHKIYKKRLISLGSVTRWAQAEEQAKGLTLVDCVLGDDGVWANDIFFLENTKAPLYKTIFPADLFSETTTVEVMYKTLLEISEKYAKLRIDFDNFEISTEDYVVLSEGLSKNKNIQLKRSARVMREILDETSGEVVTENLEDVTSYNNKFDYLSDKSIPLELRIMQYVQEDTINSPIEITQDDVISLINP